jgi:ABC-type transporter Mla maintaining outer membrane lipid asymmetry permease subunit MlaE
MLAAVSLGVAGLVVIMPHLPMLATASAIIGGYAVATYPKAKVQP